MLKKHIQKFLLAGWFVLQITAGSLVYAQEFSSSNFRVIDPVLYSAEISTSSDYQLIGSLSQPALGIGSSSDFSAISGSLAYPFVTTPVLTATAGDGSVDLSWTSSSGLLGWTVSGYHVGQASTSGGPYTYTASLGNVTSHTVTGLTNGSTYYFVVRVEDAFGNAIATTSEISATPQAAPSAPAPSGGGGVPGMFGETSTGVYDTTINVSGVAYPKGEISFLLDGGLVRTVSSNDQGEFQSVLTGYSPGRYTLGVIGRDIDGRTSPLQTIRVDVREGSPAQVSELLIPPTIESDVTEVRQGESVRMFGYAPPNAEVIASVYSDTLDERAVLQKNAAPDGRYVFIIETTDLPFGEYVIATEAVFREKVSPAGKSIRFRVGDQTVPVESDIMKGDLNKDRRVDLLDFSIAAYWYNRPFSSGFTVIERERLNNDGQITLADFSLMAYYWTG